MEIMKSNDIAAVLGALGLFVNVVDTEEKLASLLPGEISREELMALGAAITLIALATK